MRWKPNVTVAAVIEQNNHFLMIEEEADGELVINQPAGHLEENETFFEAVSREVLEETAREFEADRITGLYHYPSPHNDITYIRICFSGHCTTHHQDRQLDAGITRAMWMTRKEIEAEQKRLRSPLVLKCIDDYLAGEQYPLELLQHIT